MHGDFSRGHRPDAKREKSYTRGFAQQRRLLLDSDLNAMTDAFHERLRALARHMGCPKGSPDLGYLVTPGRLLALFDNLDGMIKVSNPVTFFRDYSRKYLDRYPSLSLNADRGVASVVTLRLRAPANGPTVIWCRAEDPMTVTLSGNVSLNVPASQTFRPVTVNLSNVQDLQIALIIDAEIWIGLIEQEQDATLAPVFNFAEGYYYLDGLPLFNPSDAVWATNLVPPSVPDNSPNPGNPTDPTNSPNLANRLFVSSNIPNLSNNDRLLVYLEGTERHVTSVEDPGIREKALGGDSDTATRGRAVGQVKLAKVPSNFDLESFSHALNNPELANGTLKVTTPQADPNPDPCALPVQGGYTGSDNRFYRFEVHTGGALGDAVFKWSRDNGSELFPVIDAPNNSTLTFPATTLLQPGDLVEILTEDTIESGDQTLAVLSIANQSFTPAVRAVGRLARLQAGTGSGTGVSFTLREPNGVGAVSLEPHFGGFPTKTLKVRRWHGLILTTVGPVPNTVEIENGIEVELTGSFSPGDYWQYEARAGSDNANGPFQITPHGPERDFAPLALMQFKMISQPLLLERWLDDRFPPLCELEADDIAFDGDHIGSESDTVQEVIEELWQRRLGCCDFTISDTKDDAAEAIRDILRNTQGEIKICFEPGVYTFKTQLVITNRKVTLEGCPRAVLVAGVDSMLLVTGTGHLVLEDLILFGSQVNGARILIDMTGQAGALEARAVGFFVVEQSPNLSPTIAIRVNGQEPSVINAQSPVLLIGGGSFEAGPSIRLDQCVAAASWVISASIINGLEITDSFFCCSLGCIWAQILSNVSIRESDMLAGVNIIVMLTWTPSSLLTRADQIVMGLADFSETINSPVNSICLRTLSMYNGDITDCRFQAGIGIAATVLGLSSLQGNQYTVTNMAIYLVATKEATIIGEQMSTFTGAPLCGVKLLLGGVFSIMDCYIDSFPIGIALGGEDAGTSLRSFQSIQVKNNDINAVNFGVQLGPINGIAYSGLLGHVAITENTIATVFIGISINSNIVGSGSLPRRERVRVADNLVNARMCIGVTGAPVVETGAPVEVSDNRLLLLEGPGPRFGIMAMNTLNLVCESNQIELQILSGQTNPTTTNPTTTNPSIANPLRAASVKVLGVFGPFIESANVTSAAIQIIGGSFARVAGNTTATLREVNGIFLISLNVETHNELSVKGNDFLSGPVLCSGLTNPVFLSNTVFGLLDISSPTLSSPTNGIVSDNRIRRYLQEFLNGSLQITNARGKWKIDDNRAEGHITITPALDFRLVVFDLGSIFTDKSKGYRAQAMGGLGYIENLAGDEKFSELVYSRPSGSANISAGGLDQAASRESVPRESASRDVALAVNNPNWRDEYVSALNDFIIAGVRDRVGPFDDISIGPVSQDAEAAIQVQCNSNWAINITVGNKSNVVKNTATIVQVIGNRAELALFVRDYAHRVIAMNIAGSYSINVASQTNEIVAPNLIG